MAHPPIRIFGVLLILLPVVAAAFRCEYCYCEYSNTEATNVPVPPPHSANDTLCAELCPPFHTTVNFCWKNFRNGVCESDCYNPSDPGECAPKDPNQCSATKPTNPTCKWPLTKSTGACWGCDTCVCGYDKTNSKTITKKLGKMTDKAICNQEAACPGSDTYSSECSFGDADSTSCWGSCLLGCKVSGDGCPQNCGNNCQCYQNTTSCWCPLNGVKPGYCYQRDHPTL